MNEQCGNVIESKGSLFRSSWPSGNVVENKGSYPQIAGMLLKTEGVGLVGGRSSVVGGERPGAGFQAMSKWTINPLHPTPGTWHLHVAHLHSALDTPGRSGGS